MKDLSRSWLGKELFGYPLWFWAEESRSDYTPVVKTDNGLRISLPGFAKSDVSITVEQGILKVKAEKDEDKFSYSSVIGQDVVSAKMENGLLEISFKEREKDIKKIDIK